MHRASAPFFFAVLLAIGATGCGSSGTHASSAAKSSTSACASGRAPVRSDFPPEFPSPRGLVVGDAYRQSGAHVTQAYAGGSLASIRDYFKNHLPAAGFRLGQGDAEASEAETDFFGHGLRGHLKLNEVPGCAGTVSVAVVTRPRK